MSAKWRRWCTSTGEVGHKDLWEPILWLWEQAGALVQLHWVPSHFNMQGNKGADALARVGGKGHPNNPLSKRRREEE